MPAPIPDDVRAAILDDIRAGKPRNQIARDHNVSTGSVTNIAKANGLTFDRAATKDATQARKTDMAAERAIVSHLFLRRAREALEQMDQPHTVFNFGGKDNTYNEKHLDRPPTGDLRNLMVTAAMGLDKHLVRERFDSGEDANQVGSLLGALLDGLQERYGTDPE